MYSAFFADLAQPDEKDIEDIRRKMAPTGAETLIVDLKEEMAEGCFLVLKSLAKYDGGYWNTTGIARAVTVQGLLKAMREKGCGYSHMAPPGEGTIRCALRDTPTFSRRKCVCTHLGAILNC